MAVKDRISKKLEIIPPDPQKHLDTILDLTAKTFGRYWQWLEHCDNGYVNDSNYDWKASRIGVLDGRVVSHYGIWDHTVWIGSAKVRIAGVGAVATDGTIRKQGLMAKTASACVDDLRGHGYQMTMLFGIRDFYHRFGYVRAWADPEWSVEVKQIPSTKEKKNSVRVKKFPADFKKIRPRLDRLYNAQNKGLTLAAIRPTYKRFVRRERRAGYFWEDSKDTLQGYVIVSEADTTLSVIDQAGDPETVLSVLADLARKACVKTITFPNLHYEHPLCRLLRSGTCDLKQRYVKSGAAMARTVDLRGTLNAMTGEFGKRLKDSPMAGWKGNLVIQDPRETVGLKIDGSRVSLLSEDATPAGGKKRSGKGKSGTPILQGGEEIVQLLIGTDSPEEVAAMGNIGLKGDALQLARILFPNRHPCLPQWDHY